MSSPSLSIVNPSLKKTLVSGHLNQKGNLKVGAEQQLFIVKDIEHQSIGTGNVIFPIHAVTKQITVNDVPLDPVDANFTGNINYSTANYNTIGISLDTKESFNNVAIDFYGGNTTKLKDSSLLYTTEVPKGINWYRNYPVTTPYFQVGMRNTGSHEGTKTANIIGHISLQKYNQFVPPIQAKDPVDRYFYANGDRIINDFENDIVLSTVDDHIGERIADIRRITRVGITKKIDALTQTNWEIGEAFDKTSNTLTDIALVSDSASDLNKTFTISGIGLSNEKISQDIICSGTSNTIGSVQMSFVDEIIGQNEGNIRVNRLTNGKPLGYSRANSGRSTGLLYVVPHDATSVVKTLSLTGRSALLLESEYNLYHIEYQDDGTYNQKLILSEYIVDGEIDKTIPVNVRLAKRDRLIGEIVSIATGSLLNGQSNFNAYVNIDEYSDNSRRLAQFK